MAANKILVISHNTFSDTNNMGITLASLFSSFSTDELCQLYLKNETPKLNICNNYFRITDYEVLISLFKSKPIGKRVYVNKKTAPISKPTKLNDLMYKIGARRQVHSYLLRDLIWSLNTWKSNNLDDWIKSNNPDVIFYATGDATFSFKIAYYISTKYNLPLVTYYCDEFYSMFENKKSILKRIYKIKFTKWFTKIIHHSKEIITISPSLSEYFKEIFSKKSHIIMTPTHEIGSINHRRQDNNPFIIAYLGNVRIRMKSLLDIADTISEINNEKAIVIFKIASLTIDKILIRKLLKHKSIDFIGSLDAKAVLDMLEKSDILVHVESFDEKSRKITKHSISTKIPSTMAIGGCIFAYGPSEVASIKYLKENDVACVCNKKNDINDMLNKLIKDKSLRLKYSDNALRLAKQNHNIDIVGKEFRRIILSAARNEQ